MDSKLSWTQVETGSAITWKYPSCILTGDNSQAEFYSVAVTNHFQQADTGTKMIHLGRNTRSTIISKGISAGRSQNSYRGLVRVAAKADGARNYSQCDSLLLGDKCGAHTFPYMDIHNETAVVEHEATTSKISEDQLFYCNQRGIPTEDAVGLIVNGYAKEVITSSRWSLPLKPRNFWPSRWRKRGLTNTKQDLPDDRIEPAPTYRKGVRKRKDGRTKTERKASSAGLHSLHEATPDRIFITKKHLRLC